MFEIERKFLVTKPLADIINSDPGWQSAQMIEQCYLSDTGSWAIRARKVIYSPKVTKYVMTLKRAITKVTNVEIEHEIDRAAYEKIASTTAREPICKMRHLISHEGNIWELDHFMNPAFDDLLLVEIELSSEDQYFAIPDWVGEEVTGKKGYGNKSLSKKLG